MVDKNQRLKNVEVQEKVGNYDFEYLFDFQVCIIQKSHCLLF